MTEPALLYDEAAVDQLLADAVAFAETTVPLSQLIAFVETEIARITGSERSRLLAGFITEPTTEQIERIAMLGAIDRFLQRCAYEPRAVADWLRGR